MADKSTQFLSAIKENKCKKHIIPQNMHICADLCNNLNTRNIPKMSEYSAKCGNALFAVIYIQFVAVVLVKIKIDFVPRHTVAEKLGMFDGECAFL